MEQKEKQLLLKDLCERLPYGVYVSNEKETFVLSVKSNVLTIIANDFKPYLRPMSSMTEDEEDELNSACMGNYGENVDWLNANHFDYRGLIPMSLAREAPEDMYKK